VLGQTHTLTATLRPEGSDPNASTTATCGSHGEVQIVFEIIGAQSNATYSPSSIDAADSAATDRSCVITASEDVCSTSYSRTAPAGTDTIRARLADDAAVTDSVTNTWTASSPTFLNVTPETETKNAQTEVSLTASVRDGAGALLSGARVDFELVSGPNDDLNNKAGEVDLGCTTGSNGTCAVKYTDATNNPAAPGNVDRLCAWLDTDNDGVFNVDGAAADGGGCNAETPAETEDSALSGTDTFGNDATDVVTKSWASAGPPALLNVTPDTDTNNVQTKHVLTAAVRNSSGTVLAGVKVDFELISGPNDDLDNNDDDSDLECTTGSAGTCTVEYTDASNNPAAPGNVDRLCAWIDSDSDTLFDDDEAVADGGDCDAESPTETENSGVSGDDSFGTDATDVMTVTWVVPRVATYLNVVPEIHTGKKLTTHDLVATVRDQNGSGMVDIEVDFEIVAGPNANLDSSEVDLDCESGSGALCDVSYEDAESTSQNDVDVICAWLDTDRDDVFSASGAANDGGSCASEAENESEDSARSGADTFGRDGTDKVRKIWTSERIPRLCLETSGAIIGTSSADQIEGTSGDDVICTLGGADTVLSGDGNDIILGGSGADTLRAGDDSDRVVGGKGGDILYGDDGRDVLKGKGGKDSLSGGKDTDNLAGGAGNDSLDGGPGFDDCRGGPGRDRKRRC